jgi:20S proteasome alpha/beta subunit
MTLVAGFVCADGLVIAADTEESALYMRSRVDKLCTYEHGGITCCAAGAGDNGDFIDALMQRIVDRLDGGPFLTTREICSAIQDTLLDYYQNELAAHPAGDE